MREIKFKIYDKELKESHIEELQDVCEDDYWYDGETDVWSVLYDSTHEQERFVALQYAGLKDKNGKEIYEGDIVVFRDEKYIVKYLEKYTRFAGTNNRCVFAAFNLSVSEVIGNIYDNPDLLKE